jgi:hypothetical protein
MVLSNTHAAHTLTDHVVYRRSVYIREDEPVDVRRTYSEICVSLAIKDTAWKFPPMTANCLLTVIVHTYRADF